MTIGLFPKRPLVVTLKRKLMLHQEVKPKCPQIQTLRLKIAVRVNFQDLPVTQVWIFSSLLLTHMTLKGGMIC